MHLHAAELINVHWTRRIEEEWTRNAAAGPTVDVEAIHACLRGMRDAVDGWEVTGHERYEPRFESVDEKDRHVAAAAFKLSLEDWPGQKVALVTRNIKDFPAEAFGSTKVSPYSPGRYIDGLYAEEPKQVIKVAEGCRRKLKRPPLDKEQYVAVLMVHRCVELAGGLAALWSVECPDRRNLAAKARTGGSF